MESLKAKLGVAAVAVSLLTAGVGGVTSIDNRYAKAKAVQGIVKDVELLELKDQLREAQAEYFFLRKQVRKYPEDEELKFELEDVKQVVEDIKQRIQVIESRID